MSVHKHTHTFTTHTHQVKEEYVKENDSIGEDEVILEFYPEEQTDHTPSRRLSNQLEYQYFVLLFTSYNMYYI